MVLPLKIVVKERKLELDSEEITTVTRTLKFDNNMVVYDAINHIKKGLANIEAGRDHGLFRLCPENDSLSVWLNEGRTLGSYDLKSGDVLEFKKKTRMLRVRLMDESEKVILIDESEKVVQILRTVCEKVGLTNPSEFGFTVEQMSKCTDEFQGIYEKSKKEKKEKEREEARLEKLAKKIQAENEINWLDPQKTLREQGVDPNDKVVLRKKYYFHDQQLDPSNLVLINLIYVQARDDILSGKHPCSLEEAIQFAGLQVQVECGPHQPEIHKPGFLDLEKFLPQEYAKDKSVEKKIFNEHRKNIPLTAHNAKYRYVQLCRALKTYGTTFFLVKEYMKGKQKLVPVLLGVNRDSIMKADQETKRILVTWKLPQVLRWASGPNHFTLDFGDDRPRYTVQTTEGESISQLLYGYVQFHVGKKFEETYALPEDTAVSFTSIESVEGQTPSYLQKVPQGARQMQRGFQYPQLQGVASSSTIKRLALPGGAVASSSALTPAYGYAPYGQMSEAEQEQFDSSRKLTGIVQSGIASINSIQAELNSPEDLPMLADDPAALQWKKKNQDIKAANVASQIAALSANTANILMLQSGKQNTQATLGKGSSVVAMSGSLVNLSKDVRRLAALTDDVNDSEALLSATRDLTEVAQKLFQFCEQEQTGIPSVDFYKTADQAHHAVVELLSHLPKEVEVDEQTVKALQDLARVVVEASKGLFKAVIAGAVMVENGEAQQAIRMEADQMTAAAVSFGKATSVLAPTINNLQCQEALYSCAQLQIGTVSSLVALCATSVLDEKANEAIEKEAQKVKLAIAAVVSRSKNAGVGIDANKEVELENLVKEVKNKLEIMDINDPSASKALESKIEDLLRVLSTDQAFADDPSREGLIQLVQQMKKAAESIHEPVSQKEVNDVAVVMLMEAHKRKCLKELEVAVKKATMVLTQLVSAANNAQSSNRNNASKKQMAEHSHAMREAISLFAPVIKSYSDDPHNPQRQLTFINESKNLLEPGAKFVATTKVASTSVGDKAVAKQMDNFSRASAMALKELKQAVEAAGESCSRLELDTAVLDLKELELKVAAMKSALDNDSLRPLPGQDDVDTCSAEVGSIVKSLGSSMAQLCGSALKGNENYVSSSARDIAQSSTLMVQSVQGIAALSEQRQVELLEASLAVLNSSWHLVEASKALTADPGHEEKQKSLQELAKTAKDSLQTLVHHLPGQRNIEDALLNIRTANQRLYNKAVVELATPVDPIERTKVANHCGRISSACLDAIAQLAVASRGTSSQLAEATRNFDEAFKEAMTAVDLLMKVTPKDGQAELIALSKDLCHCSMKMLNALQILSTEPHNAEAKASLAEATRDFQICIGKLSDTCSNSAPGVRECDASARQVAGLVNLIGSGDFPQSDRTFFECLNIVRANAQGVSGCMAEITKASKAGNVDAISSSATITAELLSEAIQAASQAVYLIGVADPNSTPAKVGIIDATKVADYLNSATAAVDSLMNTNQPSVMFAAATELKTASQDLCSLCNTAAASAQSAAVKESFISARKAIASAVKDNELFSKIKTYASYPADPAARKACHEACDQLLASIRDLSDLSGSPQFAAVAAVLPSESIEKQQQVSQVMKSLINATSSALLSAKTLAANPGDVHEGNLFMQLASNLNSACSNLIRGLSDNAPGLKECAAAVAVLQESEIDLDGALVIVEASNILPTRGDNTVEGFQENMLSSAQEIEAAAEEIRLSSLSQQQNLGKAVINFANNFLPLTASCLGAASKISDRETKKTLIVRTKKLTESARKLVQSSAKVYSCERDEAHHELDVALNEFNLDAQDLTRGLVGAVGESGALTTIVSQFERALTSLSVPPEDPDTPFMASLDAIQSTVSTLNENLPMLSQVSGDRLLSTIQDLKIVDSFNAMCLAGRTAIAKADSEEARTELRAGLTSLGATLINTLQAAKNFQQNPGDYDAKKALMQSVRSSLTEITTVKNALHHSAKGVHACHNAVNSYDYLINDLATTSIFASAGSFGEANKTCDAKKLVNEMMKVANSVKTLVHSLDATQEVIVSNVNDTVKESGLLVKAVKENAAALANDSSSQVLLINAAKDLVVALRETLRITASAVGRIENSPEVKKLTEYYQKGFKDAIISFGNTSKSLQDELARGIRASEAARNALKLELENIDAYKPPAPSPPEKILSTSSEVIQVTASLISAVLSQNQQQTTESANNTRKAVIDLLRHTKGASVTEDLDPNDTEIAINSSKLVAKAVLDMLETGALKHLHAPTEESKKSLAGHSQSIAEAVAALTAAARGLKGADFVDPNDPQAIAEKELTVAAIMIEEAAKKLAAMRPKETITFTQEMKFEDLIVNAAQQITAAASSLISAAQSAQAELKKKGRLATKIGEARYHEDAAWSEGLVSAAKEVGVATSMLCDAANSCVQGVPDSDLRMIAAAKAVSASTQRLLHACRARAECGSKEMHNLDNAGAAVVKATNALVKSAQESMAGEAAPLMDTGAIKDKLGLEMSLQIKILQREKEVETARRELERYRKMKYQK